MVERDDPQEGHGRRTARAKSGAARAKPAPGRGGVAKPAPGRGGVAKAARGATARGESRQEPVEDVPCEVVDDELTALTHPAAGEGLVAAPGAPEVAHALARRGAAARRRVKP